ncbi:hypothetical protein C8046_10170 [Serinibacter arcticus]|uniref:Uncharacterized protein n=1 Tax=Serinibacter arcticus TaxID=1655435 RepID=A0A2U1ZVG7_9MICO|nr:hypothetical protein [Serinibacter arcticus]PWD50964.1 hypothetical protein C8046_10170 [Serinibacter arcticus]
MSQPLCPVPPIPITVGDAVPLVAAISAAIGRAVPEAWVSGASRRFDALREKDRAAADRAVTRVSEAVVALTALQVSRMTAQLAYGGGAPLPVGVAPAPGSPWLPADPAGSTWSPTAPVLPPTAGNR